MKKITYGKVGDNYDTKDPIKKMAQLFARQTIIKDKSGFFETSDSRGESAFVWQMGNILMASVVEGLGTKNLVADEMRKISQKTFYDVIGYDTVATIINDLITVGAKPRVVHAYWAIEDNSWLQDKARMTDFVTGWRDACKVSMATWGGGETPTLKGIIEKDTVDLGGSAIGVIDPKDKLITDKKLKAGDRILLLKSSGINCNGLSLARAVAKKLSKGYATKLPSGKMYGEAVLTKTNIYAKLIQDLQGGGVNIHYVSNITGHGLRKIMRARGEFTYIIEKVFNPQEVFTFIQKHAGLSDEEIYQTLNMGQDYTIFLPAKEVKRAQEIIKKNKFESIDAGYVKKGPRQVVIKPKNIIFTSETLDLR
ncbi:MAG: AIR synthase-related protein [Candidatus Curtissbacteria bacterium]|nr:AIR synthase-related protein [Candidatus Curtissbacteria bacterium]